MLGWVVRVCLVVLIIVGLMLLSRWWNIFCVVVCSMVRIVVVMSRLMMGLVSGNLSVILLVEYSMVSEVNLLV